VDLAPVVRGLGRRFDLKVTQISHTPPEDDVLESSTWLLLTRSARVQDQLRAFAEPMTGTREVLWTDDLHDLVSLLRWE